MRWQIDHLIDRIRHYLEGMPKEFYGGLIIFFGIEVFYLLTLSIALSRCSRNDRVIGPLWVWLNMVPLWNIFWQFVVVNTVCESLDNEFYARRMPMKGDFGKAFGIVSCLCYLLIAIPWVGYFAFVIYLVCFIVFWVKIVQYTRLLMRDDAKFFDDDYDRQLRLPPRQEKKRSAHEDDDDPFYHEKYGDRG